METQVRVYLCTLLLTSFEPFHFLPLSKAVQGILSPLISLKPIVLSLAQCLQFIPPYFEYPYGCPLLQPNFFIVICTFCYHFLTFIQMSFYTIQLNSFISKMPVTAMLPNPMIMSYPIICQVIHSLLDGHPLRLFYFQSLLQAPPPLLDLQILW